MATCEKLPTCRFFSETMASMPASAAIMERQFCHGDFGSCARITVADVLGRDHVPPDLAPNDVTRAERMLAAARVVS